MAVAGMKFADRETISQTSFDAPARSSLRAWYTAATARIPDAPKWQPGFEDRVTIDRDVIIFHQDHWTLFIARNRRFR